MYHKACAQIIADPCGPDNFIYVCFQPPISPYSSLSSSKNLFFSVHLTLVAALFHQICSFCVSSLSFLTTCPRFFLSNSFPLHLTAVLYLLCFLLTPLDEGITFCCKLNTCWDGEPRITWWYVSSILCWI